ncbi:MAG: helicase-related protein [Ktedonobacteraceae bacterium]
MPDYVTGRKVILQTLKEELVGPSPQGKEIDCSRPLSFDDAKQSYGPWRQQSSGEEILMRDSPCKRYGVGVLYPLGTPAEEISQDPIAEAPTEPDNSQDSTLPIDDVVTEQAQQSIDKIERRIETLAADPDSYDFDLSQANAFRPSSMGISFLTEFPNDAILVVEASGGRYNKYIVHVEGRERVWWLRSPISIVSEYDATSICTLREAQIEARSNSSENPGELDLRVEVFSRPYQDNQKRLITVCLVNRSKARSQMDQYCLFQAHFKVSIISSNGKRLICPYPGSTIETIENTSQSSTLWNEEERSLALLYRKANTFAVGHGCAANWESIEGTWQDQLTNQDHKIGSGVIDDVEYVGWVGAENLPFIEVPSITPDVKRKNGTTVEVAMAELAGLIPGKDGFAALSEVIDLYEEWIRERSKEISALDHAYKTAAQRHLTECSRCAARMREGLTYLRTNPKALRAFQLANHAILLQQVRSGQETRKTQFDAKETRFIFSPHYADPDPLKPREGRGMWRAFQVAFLLMAIPSTAEYTNLDRETVELIWFPTGGGKTEAYLGLAAFAMFMRRLDNKNDDGVQVLMRYTLRLLTAQQFQRASGLLCAMEYLRRKNTKELGTKEFSIGIWLGGSTTPNTRQEAISILNGLRKNNRFTENKFILSRCPWCQAQIGPLTSPDNKKNSRVDLKVAGYDQQGNTVVFRCPDNQCDFTDGLPVYVIDEDIYDKRPSMLIGTVDKFALLAWKPDVRKIFGIGPDGARQSSPPGLIIQDELHLISGPLGSMVGLYETIIEELCTDKRGGKTIPPKIVSSTATIRRYAEQIKRLYARDNVALFPPPGLSADDSFFARYATNDRGKLAHGRIYVGVHAPGLGSLQTTQVRSFTALLQASLALPVEQRDPWWTLLLFFNSLRELGTTLSLLQSDIPDYFRVLMNRMGLDYSQVRKFWNILELTGRLRNEEVPEAISKLEVKYQQDDQKARPVDVCLASNIIEVGIDIDRLSLMSVIGQPKTTSQYIQVTGRVGRRWWEKPGLVVTLYGASKPRDRSHFEKFRSYHERLYAQVEPTSVTPFSPPVLDRALHAIMVSYVRQLGDRNATRRPYPYPDKLIDQLREIILPRVEAVDVEERQNFIQVFDKRSSEWKQWQRNVWEDRSGEEIPLLRYAGSYASPEQARLSWATATSMRDVDAQCEAIITSLYAMQGETEDDSLSS